MKTRILLLFMLCLSFFCNHVFASGYEKDRENWMPILKEIYGDKQPSVKQSDTIDNVRELKYPGQRFIHMGVVQLNGKGKLVKKHKYWFDSQKSFQLQHQSDFAILEEIISSENELDDGIIRSRFTVQHFNEQLVSATAGGKIGFIESNDIIKALKNFKKAHGTTVNELGDKLIEYSAKATVVAAGAAVAPDVTATKVTAAGAGATAAVLFGSAMALKILNWGIEKISNVTDDDGNIILSKEDVQKMFPDVDKLILRLHRLEGTTVETIWVAQNGKRKHEEIGYTQFDILTNNSDITEDDKKMLAKMIYRANPFGVKTVLPEDKKGSGSIWEINANDITSWLATAGIDYDTVNGIIRVKDFGSSMSQKYEDENALQNKKEITVTTLKAITKDNDRLKFMKKLKDSTQVKMSVIPTSAEIVVVTPEADEDVPNYIKEVNVNGRIESHIDRPTGLLTDIEYEENTVMINYAYTQLRMPIKTENKTTSSGSTK